jgi:hypothetical protein
MSDFWTKTNPYDVKIPGFSGTAPTGTKRYTPTTKTYDPTADMTGNTKYSGTEDSAVSRLNSIIANGGYSPEQLAKMTEGAMAPVYQQAAKAKEASQGDAYSRGLGQSSVLSRSYGDIDSAVLGNMAQLSGDFTKQGADMVPQAIQLAQSGAGQYLDYQKSLAQIKAQLNMNDAQMEEAFARINSTADQSDADRQLSFDKMKNDFNLSDAQLQLLVQQAENDRKYKSSQAEQDFWSNLIGSIASLGGTALGKFLPTGVK